MASEVSSIVDLDPEISDQDFVHFQKSADLFQQNKEDYAAADRVSLEALLMQIQEGDCKKTKPSLFKREELRKWKEWKKLEGISMEAAIKEFVKRLSKATMSSIQTSKSGHYI